MTRKSKGRRTKKKSIKNASMVSKKRYSQLLAKKSSKKRMTKRDEKDLDRALFVNYCKCIKRLKYSEDYEKGLEYPICTSSIYKKRGLKSPKDINKRCNQYR
jgi:hypothetical protein